MYNLRNSILSVIAITMISTVAQASEKVKFSIGINHQTTDLSGELSIGALGNTLDLENDLGLTGKDRTIVPEIIIKNGNHSINLSYEKVNFNGHNTLSKSINIGKSNYSLGTDISTDITRIDAVLGYKYSLLNSSNLFLSAGIDLNYMDLKADFTSSVKSTSYEGKVVLPTIAMDLSYNINDEIKLKTNLSGIGYKNNSYLVSKTEVNYTFNDSLSANLGYKYQNTKFDIDNDQANVNSKGIYAGLNYSF